MLLLLVAVALFTTCRAGIEILDYNPVANPDAGLLFPASLGLVSQRYSRCPN